MVINMSVHYNGGFLPDTILLTQDYYHWGARYKYHVVALYLQPMYTKVVYYSYYNGGLLPDIIPLTQCYFHRGTRLNVMKRFCICSL